MKQYLFYIIFFILVNSQSYAQDKISIKKTKAPLHFNLKITEVGPDSIKFKAFGKNNSMPLSDVLSYKIKGAPRVNLTKTNSSDHKAQGKIATIEQLDSISRAEKKFCLTVGILQGGGSLIGTDLEIKLIRKFSVQAGIGLLGYGGAINYHFKPRIKSSCLSFSYWHQGLGPTYVQSIVGPTYVFRHRKGFTAQIGLGKITEISAFGLRSYEQRFPNRPPPTLILMYSIGWCFAF